MDQSNPIVRLIYAAMAAFAGSVTALAFTRWKEMSRGEVALAVFTGFSFAMFVTPWIAHAIMGIPETDGRAISGLTYVFAAGSNALLPTLIHKLNRLMGTDK
jgi:hypothetical protein